MINLISWLVTSISSIINSYGLFISLPFYNVNGSVVQFISLANILTFVIIFGLIITFFRLIQE